MSQVMLLCFFTITMVCYSILWGVRSISSFSYLDVVLSSVSILYFSTMMAGYSILGFYPVEVMHSFKFIRK